MRLQKIERSQAVRKTGTVKKKPAMNRTLNQLRSPPPDMMGSRITPRARRSRKPRPRALVTGGAVRLGRAIALLLGRSGMDVAIGYHRSARQARRTVRDLERAGARGVALAADLADPRAAARLVRRAARALGGLDVPVNSAPRLGGTPLAATTPARHARLLALN